MESDLKRQARMLGSRIAIADACGGVDGKRKRRRTWRTCGCVEVSESGIDGDAPPDADIDDALPPPLPPGQIQSSTVT